MLGHFKSLAVAELILSPYQSTPSPDGSPMLFNCLINEGKNMEDLGVVNYSELIAASVATLFLQRFFLS